MILICIWESQKKKTWEKALSKSFTDDGTWLNPVEMIKKGIGD